VTLWKVTAFKGPGGAFRRMASPQRMSSSKQGRAWDVVALASWNAHNAKTTGYDGPDSSRLRVHYAGLCEGE
jgi:hypothetical protein